MTSFSEKPIHGVMVGKVTNNMDPEGLGRIKVNLPMVSDDYETDWCRVATLMSGGGRGSYFLPEPGDDVLVSFHLGDLKVPYVVGYLWSDENTPPPVDDFGILSNNIRTIVSRAGHEITFDDGMFQGKVTIKTRRGQVIEMDDLFNTTSITDISGGMQININGFSGETSIQAGPPDVPLAKVSVNAMGKVTVEGALEVNVTSTLINVKALGMLNLEGIGGVNIKGAGPVMISGAIVKIN